VHKPYQGRSPVLPSFHGQQRGRFFMVAVAQQQTEQLNPEENHDYK
jgi:hypothetical protein